MKKALMIAALLGLPQAAMASQCPVPYSEFEANIPHIDMAECPDNQPNEDAGFCRLVMDGKRAYVYAFLYTDEEPCLSAISKADKKDYFFRP